MCAHLSLTAPNPTTTTHKQTQTRTLHRSGTDALTHTHGRAAINAHRVRARSHPVDKRRRRRRTYTPSMFRTLLHSTQSTELELKAIYNYTWSTETGFRCFSYSSCDFLMVQSSCLNWNEPIVSRQSTNYYPSENFKQIHVNKATNWIFLVGISAKFHFEQVKFPPWSAHFVILKFETMASAEVELPSKVSTWVQNVQFPLLFVGFNTTGYEWANIQKIKNGNFARVIHQCAMIVSLIFFFSLV